MNVTITQNDDGKFVLRNDGVEAGVYDTAEAAKASPEMQAILLEAFAAMVNARTGESAATETDDGDGMDMEDGPNDALLPGRWTSGPYGVCMKAETGPSRDFTTCTFSWRASPLPLMMVVENEGGHYGAVWCGTIDTISGRQDGGVDMAGTFFNSDCGQMAASMLEGQGQLGVSIDPSEYVTAEFVCTQTDDEGWCEEGKWVFTEYEIAGLTIVPMPGFANAFITPEGVTASAAGSEGAPVTAAASSDDETACPAPLNPPRHWFETPEPQLGTDEGNLHLVRQPPRWDGDLDEIYAVPLTIGADGRVFGHLAAAGTCHIGYQGQCVTVPASTSAYARFHLNTVETAEGDLLAVGPLVVGCDHALHNLRAPAARDHYANSALAWADVRIVDGVHGPWVTGALRPDVNLAQLRVIRGCSLSGDWRDHGGALDLVAAQLVSTAGFPIVREAISASAMEPAEARIGIRMERGRVVALTAAGIVHRAPEQIEALVAAGSVAACDDCAQRRRDTAAAAAAARRDDQLGDRLTRIEAILTSLDIRTRHQIPAATEAARQRLAQRIGAGNGSFVNVTTDGRVIPATTT